MHQEENTMDVKLSKYYHKHQQSNTCGRGRNHLILLIAEHPPLILMQGVRDMPHKKEWLHVCTLVSSVVSNSLRPCELWSSRIFSCPWGLSRKEYLSGLPALLQGIFSTQGWNPHILHLLHCSQVLYHQRNLVSSKKWMVVF